MNRNFAQLILNAAFIVLILCTPPLQAQTTEGSPGKESPALPEEEFKRFKIVLEPDAYYSDLELIIALSKVPIPHIGEKKESEIYRTLLSRAAVLPQYLVLEGSVNPMPYLGVYLKRNEPRLYENAQISGSFNWIQALTAGFEEPYAVSLLAGNVVTFDDPENREIKGNGYSGYLFSAGNYHIRNNVMIHDRWQEIEWKIKGDRKSPVKKLSWSFRVGAKLHANPYVTDILYLSFRRSRLDYKPRERSLLNNSGFEYTLDVDRSFTPMRHYFYVDKKWPIENKQMAFTVAAGFVWESSGKYSGPLAASQGTNFQFLLRPNIEF